MPDSPSPAASMGVVIVDVGVAGTGAWGDPIELDLMWLLNGPGDAIGGNCCGG